MQVVTPGYRHVHIADLPDLIGYHIVIHYMDGDYATGHLVDIDLKRDVVALTYSRPNYNPNTVLRVTCHIVYRRLDQRHISNIVRAKTYESLLLF